MARAKKVEQVVEAEAPSIEVRVAVALERIARALERTAGPGGALNPPTGPIEAVTNRKPDPEPVGTLEEETAKLQKALAKAKAEAPAKPKPPPEPEANPLAGLLGDEAQVENVLIPTATFAQAREALMQAAKDAPVGIGAEGVLKVLKAQFGVEKLSAIPKEDEKTLGRFVAALAAAPRK